MIQNTNRPLIDNKIFWDVNPNTIDFVKHADWVIARVFNYGNEQAINQIIEWYGNDKVGEVLIADRNLKAHAIERAVQVLGIPLNKFHAPKKYGYPRAA